MATKETGGAARKKKAKPEETATEVVAVQEEKKDRKMSENILELDMNLEEMADFVPLPAGPYPAEVVVSEPRISDKGNEYYYLQFKIDANDYPADYDVENAPDGTVLTYARVQKPDPKNRRSITNFKNLMRALGVPLNSNKFDAEDWIGKKAKLTVRVSEWNGENRNEIQSVESLDD